MPEEKPLCFVICPIGDEGSPTRQRSNDVFEYIIKPAAQDLGYRAERTVEEPRSGWLTDRIVRYLVEAPMVVADLTDRNPNVFYELAIRHVTRKPFVQMMQEGQQVPFDISGLETIFYDPSSLRSAAGARESLVRQMRHAAKNPSEIRTPVSIAGDLLSVGSSDNPILAVIEDLAAGQRSLEARMRQLAVFLHDSEVRMAYGRRDVGSSGFTASERDEIAQRVLDAVEMAGLMADGVRLRGPVAIIRADVGDIAVSAERVLSMSREKLAELLDAEARGLSQPEGIGTAAGGPPPE
jgi:hypothetical protein